MPNNQTIIRSSYVKQISVNPKGGVPKYRVPSAEITKAGVVGDKQRNLKYHGGPERAVCLYSYERIQLLQAEGHPIDCGTTGENLTLIGIDWDTVSIGDRLRIGEQVELEITSYAAPCNNINGSFLDGESKRISQKLHPGWSRLYTKVLQEGEVHEGDIVQLLGTQ